MLRYSWIVVAMTALTATAADKPAEPKKDAGAKPQAAKPAQVKAPAATKAPANPARASQVEPVRSQRSARS